MRDGRPQDFADADLPGTTFHHIQGQTQKSETGHDEGEYCKGAEDLSNGGIGLVQRVVIGIQEGIFEWVVGREFLPDPPDGGDGFGRVASLDPRSQVRFF